MNRLLLCVTNRLRKFQSIKTINIKSCFAVIFSIYIASTSCASQPGAYENSRSLGMGGCSLCYTDDYLLLYRNPAGLCLKKEAEYSVLTPTFSRNSDFSKIDKHIDALKDNDTAVTRISNYSHLESMTGKTGFQRWSNTAYYIGEKGFGVGVRYDDYQFYRVDNPSNPQMKSSVYKDCVVSGSFARPIEDQNQNIFKDKAVGWYGASLKIATRKKTESVFYARDFAALTPNAIKDTDRTGITLDADFGALWQLTNPLKTTFGVFIGNIFESKFSDEAGNLNRQYSIGASIQPLTGEKERNERLVLACEYFDDGSHVNSLTNIRLGARAKIANGFYLSTGVKNGYLTGGMDFSFKDFSIGASTYSEELGKSPGDREDRRYSVDASLRF